MTVVLYGNGVLVTVVLWQWSIGDCGRMAMEYW